MIIFGIEIRAERWPWQDGYNWRGMTKNSAPLNAGGGRFGGGWKYKLGFAWGGTTLMVDLLFGMLIIKKATRCDRCKTYIDGPRRYVWLTKPGFDAGTYHRSCFEQMEKEANEPQVPPRAAVPIKAGEPAVKPDPYSDVPF